MTKVFVVAVLTPIILLVAGALLAHRARRENRYARLATMIMLFVVLFSMLSGVVGVVLWRLEKRDYDVCVQAVSGRNGFRDLTQNDQDSLKALQAEVDAKSNGQLHLDSIDAWIDQKEQDLKKLPERSLEECPKP